MFIIYLMSFLIFDVCLVNLNHVEDISVDPYLFNTLNASENGVASLIVTFKSQSVTTQYTDQHFLFHYFNRCILSPSTKTCRKLSKKILRQLKNNGVSLVKAKDLGKNFDKFLVSKALHILRGQYVYDAQKSEALETKRLIEPELKKFKKFRSIKTYIVSNSWAIEGDIEVVHFLLNSTLVSEIHLDRPFKVEGIDVVDLQFQDKGFIHGLEVEHEARCKERHYPYTNKVEWNINHIGASNIWNITTGQDMIFASADTGVDWTHYAITNNYAGRKYSAPGGPIRHDYAWWDGVKKPLKSSFGRCGINSQFPCDDKNHGTHTTSIAVGSYGIGVAPGAIWIACRNMDQGFGSPQTYLDCLEFFLAPTDLYGLKPDPSKRPHVISNSYSCEQSEGCAPRAFRSAVQTLRKAGVVMVVSAGNEGPKCGSIEYPPSIEPDVFTVGATRHLSDQITFFSSRGPINIQGIDRGIVKPELVAPGGYICGASPKSAMISLHGTSMAAPHVSGAVLLISAACPSVQRKPGLIKKILLENTRPIPIKRFNDMPCGMDTPDRIPNHIYGHGMIQIDKAILDCLQDDISVMS